METQDQKRTSPSGHETHGNHVCHKCGWPFPNPHPSSRHRRAHKKICGTIEGYKLTGSEDHTHLTVSDDEHLSDDDRRTPSPKIEKRSIKEASGGGIGERSNRSEDEVFSDAVAEFLDSGFSPGIEERLEGLREPDKNVEKTVEGDLDPNQLLKVDANAETTELLNSSADSSKTHNSEVLESAITRPFQDIRTEELAVELSNINGSPRELSHIKSETLADAPQENLNGNGDNVMKNLMTSLGNETDVKESEEDVNKILTDVAEPPSKTASKASEAGSELQVTDGSTSDSATPDRIVESKKGKSDVSGFKMSEHYMHPEVESVDNMEAAVNSVRIEEDSAHDIDVGGHGDLVDVCDTKGEGTEGMHVLSVANDLPLVDRPDIMIEDFKDHKELKSNLPLILGSAEVIRSVEDDSIDTVYEDSHSSFHSSKLAGTRNSSSADMDAVEHNLKQEVEDNKLTTALTVEEEDDISELKLTSGEDIESNGFEALSVTSRTKTQKIQTNHGLRGLQPHSSENELSHEMLSESTTMDLSDVVPVISSVHEEVNRTTNLSGGDNNDEHEMVKIQEFVTAGNGGREGVIEELLPNPKTTLESADSLSVTKIDQTINLPGGDDAGVPEKGTAERSDISQTESTEEAAAEEKSALNTKIQEFVTTGNGGREGVIEELLTNSKTTLESAGSLSVTEFDQTINLPRGDDAGTAERSVISQSESTDEAAAEEKGAPNTKIQQFVTAGNGGREGVIEELLANSKTTLQTADSLFVTEIDQTINLPGEDDAGVPEKGIAEHSDISQSESTEEAAAEEKSAPNTKTKLESAHQFTESKKFDCVPGPTEVDIDTSNLGNMTQTHSSSQKCPPEDSQEVSKDPETNNDSEFVADCVGAVDMGSESNHNVDVEVSENNSEHTNLKEPGSLPTDSELAIKSSSTSEGSNSKDVDKSSSSVISDPLQEEGNGILIKGRFRISSVDISVDSSSQTESSEGKNESVSVLSTQSDAPAFAEVEALQSADSQAPAKSENINLQKPKTSPEGCHSDKSDVFEPPSFMTLVQPEGGVKQNAAASEIETEENTQQPTSQALQAGWFPSLTNVVNESPGRKKNEEVIAKVTDKSSGKHHTPLKDLLGEAHVATKPKSPNPNQISNVIQKDETAAKKNGALAATVPSVMGSEAPADQTIERETGKEWNSPARYLIDNKREKRKVKGRPSWVPFVCCSSVN